MKALDKNVASEMDKAKGLAMVLALSGAVILLGVFFNEIPLATVTSFLGLIGLMGAIVYFKTELLVKYMTFFYMVGITSVGIVICELIPTYLVELKTRSGFAGSAPLLFLGYWVFFAMLLLLERAMAKSGIDYPDVFPTLSETTARVAMNIGCSLVLVLYVLMFMKVATKPAFLMGLDRFYYATEVFEGSPLNGLRAVLPTLLIIPAACLSRGSRKLGIITLFLYLLYSVWVGEKFGSFFLVFILVLIANYHSIRIFLKKNPIKVLGVIAGCVILLVGYAVAYVTFVSDGPSNYLMQRTAQQGQLWWKTFQETEGVAHPAEFSKEVDGMLNGPSSIKDNVGSDYGIYKIMYLCAPDDYIDMRLSNGSRFTDAAFPLAYYYFGVPGVVLYGAISGFIACVITNLLIASSANGSVLILLVICRFYNMFRTTFVQMTLSDYVDLASVMSYVLIALSLMLRKAVDRGLGKMANETHVKMPNPEIKGGRVDRDE